MPVTIEQSGGSGTPITVTYINCAADVTVTAQGINNGAAYVYVNQCYNVPSGGGQQWVFGPGYIPFPSEDTHNWSTAICLYG
ncbi:hypothetical protein [Kutzneria sp. CA-103260]|uniref:hypothetical protein n=1 Tax=Kutzneria sp. CA-103260 TaxID=2802641 RepID=UPI001BA87921|nr:hypothetical protein [Kutzneria sp. CA-103260]